MSDFVLGMMRALKVMENCDGDLDFAIFSVKKDIQTMREDSEAEVAPVAQAISPRDANLSLPRLWGGTNHSGERNT